MEETFFTSSITSIKYTIQLYLVAVRKWGQHAQTYQRDTVHIVVEITLAMCLSAFLKWAIPLMKSNYL